MGITRERPFGHPGQLDQLGPWGEKSQSSDLLPRVKGFAAEIAACLDPGWFAFRPPLRLSPPQVGMRKSSRIARACKGLRQSFLATVFLPSFDREIAATASWLPAAGDHQLSAFSPRLLEPPEDRQVYPLRGVVTAATGHFNCRRQSDVRPFRPEQFTAEVFTDACRFLRKRARRESLWRLVLISTLNIWIGFQYWTGARVNRYEPAIPLTVANVGQLSFVEI